MAGEEEISVIDAKPPVLQVITAADETLVVAEDLSNNHVTPDNNNYENKTNLNLNPSPSSTPDINKRHSEDDDTENPSSNDYEKSCVEVPGSVFVKWDITRKNKTSIVINGYKMTESRAGKDQRVFWRCSKRFCSATAISLGNQLLSVRQVSEAQFHNHPPTAREEFFRGDYASPGTLTHVVLKWPVSVHRSNNSNSKPPCSPAKRSRHDSRDTTTSSCTPPQNNHDLLLQQQQQTQQLLQQQQQPPRLFHATRFVPNQPPQQPVFQFNPSLVSMEAQNAFLALAAKVGATGMNQEQNGYTSAFQQLHQQVNSTLVPPKISSPSQALTAPRILESRSPADLRQHQDSPLKDALNQVDRCHLRRELHKLETYFQTNIVNMSSNLCRGVADQNDLGSLLKHLKGLERVYSLLDMSDKKSSLR